MSSKEAMLLFQQQEKSFVIIVPSNLFHLKAWEKSLMHFKVQD